MAFHLSSSSDSDCVMSREVFRALGRLSSVQWCAVVCLLRERKRELCAVVMRGAEGEGEREKG
jgi:hypothetical protein